MTTQRPRWDRSELALVALFAAAVPLAYSLVLVAQARSGPAGTVNAVLRNTIPAAVLGIAAWVYARFAASQSTSRMLAMHIVAALSYGFIWALATFSGFGLWPDPRPWESFARFSLAWFLLFGALLYAVVAGAAHLGLAKAALRAERESALRAQHAATLAQLEALRARLNPHFLFNALHSMSILARDNPPAVTDGLRDLGQLLRYTLRTGEAAGSDVALDDELAFVRDYLALERMRFGERLSVTTTVDDEARECGIPAFILQPLVENAIQHAIAARPEGGSIAISARVHGDELILGVSDDGPGPGALPASDGTGLGLQLVRHMLQVRYGDDARCTLSTIEPRGARAEIVMPARAP